MQVDFAMNEQKGVRRYQGTKKSKEAEATRGASEKAT
jgi:hypothetical protein